VRQASRPRISIRSYGGRAEAHAHEFHQVVLPVAGVLDMSVGTVAGRVDASAAVLVPAGTAHGFRSAGENRFVVLDVPARADLFEPLARGVGGPFFAVDAALSALARYLAAEAAGGAVDPATEAHACALLLRSLERRLPRAGPETPVARALRLMRERRAEPLSVPDVAREVGLAPSRFHELFRQETGTTPARRLAELRLDLAEEMLAGGIGIAEVALACGFSEQSALTRALRRVRGTTPSALTRR
jgi:AraC-like DNA-binding protein